jgi:hypothetical protein
MAVQVTIGFHNSNPNTIWNTLARKLGHEPTNAEAKAEIDRIFVDARAAREDLVRQPRRRAI